VINKKALEELVKPRDDGGEKIEITKADLRWLLGSCEWCAFMVGLGIGALALALILAAVHGGR